MNIDSEFTIFLKKSHTSREFEDSVSYYNPTRPIWCAAIEVTCLKNEKCFCNK